MICSVTTKKSARLDHERLKSANTYVNIVQIFQKNAGILEANQKRQLPQKSIRDVIKSMKKKKALLVRDLHAWMGALRVAKTLRRQINII